MDMVIILSLRWWYGAGWKWAWQRSVSQRITWCLEAFSIPQLTRTWLSPFKQTYVGGKRKSIDAAVRGLVDNLVSRVIGAIARTLIIFAGLICMFFAFLSGVVFVILWPFIPLSPIIAVVLAVGGTA